MLTEERMKEKRRSMGKEERDNSETASWLNASCGDKKSRKQQQENRLRTVMPFRGQNDIL